MNPILKNISAEELLLAYAEKCVECAADMISDMASNPEWLRSELEVKLYGPFSNENILQLAKEQAFETFPDVAYENIDTNNDLPVRDESKTSLEDFLMIALLSTVRNKRFRVTLS